LNLSLTAILIRIYRIVIDGVWERTGMDFRVFFGWKRWKEGVEDE
jgi:hypothetical protein